MNKRWIHGGAPQNHALTCRGETLNPRNAFWRITGEIFGFAADGLYDDRTAALKAHGIAVWDVLQSCRRVGSLDSAVERDSMVPNDFGRLFSEHPTIRRVFFNGAASERNVNRLVRVAPLLQCQRLPSTSPAQTMPYADKLTAWRVIGES
jgi:hypoxanthine-DNA glycosylase